MKCKNCGHRLQVRLVKENGSKEYAHIISKNTTHYHTISVKCKCGCTKPESSEVSK